MKIDLSLAISIVSILIALLAMLSSFLYLKETVYYNRETSRAQITLFTRYVMETSSWELILKNFGNSSGLLLDVKTDPVLSYANSTDPNDEAYFKGVIPITDLTDCFLAPGQSIFCDFPFESYPDQIFSVTLRYKTLNRLYTESYTINIASHMKVMVVTGSHPDAVVTLEDVVRSIQLLSRKF